MSKHLIGNFTSVQPHPKTGKSVRVSGSIWDVGGTMKRRVDFIDGVPVKSKKLVGANVTSK